MQSKDSGIRQDLFQRCNVRDLSVPEGKNRPKRSLKGVNLFQMGISVLLIISGALSVTAGIIGLLSVMWISSALILGGSISIMAGFFLMLDTVRERKSIDNLVKNAIMRSIEDLN